MKWPLLSTLLMALACSNIALADKPFSGEDAAYVDWAVKNCEGKSTDKEHAMVDQANAKDAPGFLRKYLGKDLSGALATPSKQAALCAQIKDWYGPQGSRFADLLSWQSAPTSAASDTPKTTKSDRRGRRRANP